MSRAIQEEIEACGRDNPGGTASESTFQPLRTLPADVPKGHRRYWKKLAAQAHTSYMAAIQLKCLDCAAWNRPEAAHCDSPVPSGSFPVGSGAVFPILMGPGEGHHQR